MRWSPLVQIESKAAASACCASSLITDHGRTGSTPPPHHSSIGMIIPTFTLPVPSRLVFESRRRLRACLEHQKRGDGQRESRDNHSDRGMVGWRGGSGSPVV